MADFSIKQGDSEPTFTATLKDSSGAVVDLTTAVSAQFRMRKPGERAHVVGSMGFGSDRTLGVVTYSFSVEETRIVGSGMEAVVVIEWPDSEYQTFPTVGYVSIDVLDNIDVGTADLDEDIVLPGTTLVLYGSGYWPWTPTVLDALGAPVSGASVSVITSVGITHGPGTTDVDGQVLAEDGLGAFRLDSGTYTVNTVYGGVSHVQTLTIDSSGNGVLT